jgi:hypothetical protein
MSLQLAPNGTFMCGHNYGDVAGNEESSFGFLLLARTKADLRASWQAVSAGIRPVPPLSEATDFFGGKSDHPELGDKHV